MNNHIETIQTTQFKPDMFRITQGGALHLGEFGMREAGFFALQLADPHRESIETQATQCLQAFSPEPNTKVATDHNLPTLLARVDCALDGNEVRIFECDERPAGVGITNFVMGRAGRPQELLTKVQTHFMAQVGDTPVIARHPEAKPNDDFMAFGDDVVELNHAKILDRPLIVRGEPEHFAGRHDLSALQARSLSTITTEGDKQYMQALPGHETVFVGPETEVDPAQSFVLKPLQGSKAKGVMVYLSPQDRKRHGKNGLTSFTKAQEAIELHRTSQDLLIEDFRAPTTVSLDGNKIGNVILRIFCLVGPGAKTEVIGGTYVVRRELIVHGAANALVGAVLVQ